ncbi:hypothetical protein [Psychrobacillus psychrodurans]|uniref:hypothetical protein n=1 Tax=Psychrobacillus psychrodurans TaxID=126157 RepID=UPI0008E38CFB|nr:hypothetical protein [Psychrobacillus psychrodurans]MCZ8541979.1 hypothetical protein [Psychrobacillus psychrodurans]SFN13817.1 hypothetical protein SAMN05421832_11639 [Psychrobacillus psychrodurans]
MIPIIYFVAVIKDGTMYWQDERLYRTEEGARKRKEKLLAQHPKHLTVLYADEFKQAIGG